MDYLEKNGLENDSKEWNDIFSHALRCPDCSIDLQNRKNLMETMADMPEISIPTSLHRYIMDNLDAGEPEEISFFDTLFERFAKPLQISISFACIFMLFSLLQLPDKIAPIPISKVEMAMKNPTSPQVVNEMSTEEKLEDVSQEEIKNFLAKLEKFRKSHPESEKKLPIPAAPELRLVIDKN
jgi:hypothetical protein